jgi:hypothetical protein
MEPSTVDAIEGERKQQAVIDTAVQQAAVDPQPAIPPDVIEKALVEESLRAGAVAYQFEPDAPPEEKAAVAKSVSVPASRSCCSLPVDGLIH